MLTSTTAPLLAVLSPEAGLTTGWVSDMAQVSYSRDNRRARSHAIRSWLLGLKSQGLVDYLDEQKPVCWKITPAGRAALEEWNRKNIVSSSVTEKSDA